MERDCTRRQVQTFSFFHAATDEEAQLLVVVNSEYHPFVSLEGWSKGWLVVTVLIGPHSSDSKQK